MDKKILNKLNKRPTTYSPGISIKIVLIVSSLLSLLGLATIIFRKIF